ncbi:MAG: AraC family transcriptional regulator [Evtepia sp.]|nr:AraC family transcriptional regulator [Evtepia sp.]
MEEQETQRQEHTLWEPEGCRPFPGVWLRFADDPEKIGMDCPGPKGETLELHFCRAGRVQVGSSSPPRILTGGSVWFVPHPPEPVHLMSKKYTGLSLFLAPHQAREVVEALSAEILDTALDLDRLTGEFQANQGRILPGTNTLGQVMVQLFSVPHAHEAGFLRLKTLELLLCLDAGKPKNPGRETPYLDQSQVERIREVQQYVTTHLDCRLTQAQLARQFHLSLTALKQTFHRVYGMPLNAYLRNARLSEAKHLLQETSLPVAEIAHRVGYESHSQFTSVFRASEGMTPAVFRRDKAGYTIPAK